MSVAADLQPAPAAVCRSPDCKEGSFLACRVLDDGWVIHLVPMMFNVRIVIEHPRDNATGCYTDGWCYDRARVNEALVAMALWDGRGDPPGPWKKHVTSGRRGPGAELRDEDDDTDGEARP
jgi:hypothetical protein